MFPWSKEVLSGSLTAMLLFFKFENILTFECRFGKIQIPFHVLHKNCIFVSLTKKRKKIENESKALSLSFRKQCIHNVFFGLKSCDEYLTCVLVVIN